MELFEFEWNFNSLATDRISNHSTMHWSQNDHIFQLFTTVRKVERLTFTQLYHIELFKVVEVGKQENAYKSKKRWGIYEKREIYRFKKKK